MAQKTYVERWKCPRCGSSFGGLYSMACSKCQMTYAGDVFDAKHAPKCSKCGKEVSLSFNTCMNCGAPVVPNRLRAGERVEAKGLPESETYCLLIATESVILAQPNPNAERLYVVGAGTALEHCGEADRYYEVYTPVGTGFLPKSVCWLVQVGVRQAPSLLGYAHSLEPKKGLTAWLIQPDGSKVELDQLHGPQRIIRETDTFYEVEVNGSLLRCFLEKRECFRTLTTEPPRSAEQEGNKLLAALAVASGIVALEFAGATADAVRKDWREMG